MGSIIYFFSDEEPTGWKIYANRFNPTGYVAIERYFITSDGWLIPYSAVGNSQLIVT